MDIEATQRNHSVENARTDSPRDIIHRTLDRSRLVVAERGRLENGHGKLSLRGSTDQIHIVIHKNVVILHKIFCVRVISSVSAMQTDMFVHTHSEPVVASTIWILLNCLLKVSARCNIWCNLHT